MSDSIELAADVMETIEKHFFLVDTTIGVLEIGAGFIGFGSASAFEIGSLGAGTLVAAPVAAGATVLIADGVRRIGSGYALFKKASNILETFKRKNPGNMQKQVQKNQTPKSIRRVDKGSGAYEKDHIHFEDGAALNVDGTWKHRARELTKSEIE